MIYLTPVIIANRQSVASGGIVKAALSLTHEKQCISKLR